VGGHCLTKDTYHLERGVKILEGDLDYPNGKESLFVLARTINDFMPIQMYNLTQEGIKRTGKSLEGSKIALLGWAFLGNSDDARNTPSEKYRDLLIESGCKVEIHDPHVLEYPGITISHDLPNVLENADAIAILTGHREYFDLDAARVKELTGKELPVIVDGRNVIYPDTFIDEGFVYKGIGRGDKNLHPIEIKEQVVITT
jgi:UDP-N-acetyl-D-mannosaminuronic acid dehydrogenase